MAGAPINVADYERLAEERLDPATFGYFAGGAGDEVTLRENVDAFGRLRIRPRVLVDVGTVSTATSVLGTEVAMPILIAPVALQRVIDPEGERATARAAAAAGTIMCLSTAGTTSPEDVAAAAPGGAHWYQVYVFKDRGVTRELVGRAIAAGFRALVLTADTPYLGRRERDLRLDFAVSPEIRIPSYEAAGQAMGGAVHEVLAYFDATFSWRDLEQLASESSVPVLVKGVLTAEDARLAVEHGAAGVVVSNHGGRQLDGVPASIEALPEVAEAVGGAGEVLLDGGVRRGTDVVKALARGARTVLVGRAAMWGLAVAGENGVRDVLRLLRDELELALALCGAPSPDAVTPDLVA